MAELVWRGKRSKRRAPVARPAAPRVEEVRGDPAARWHDRLILGKAERVLPALVPTLAGKVSLVYFDPPYGTGGAFDYLVAIPGSPEGAARVAVPAFRDSRDVDAWLSWFHRVAALLRELLADGGSLYVHLDAHVAHYAKVVLDETFGPAAFQREIVWRIGWISGFKARARGWIRNHDTILFYAKGGRPSVFHKAYLPYPAGYVRRDGAQPKGAGYPLEDVWNASETDRLDSIQIVSFSGEKVGYPTQKNEALVARIVSTSSNPGDLVLDCCAGSGTSPVVAAKLGRRWIACDASPVAIHAARKRLLAAPVVRPFVVERSGRDRPREGDLSARAVVDGLRCTIELASYRPAASRGAHVSHWSQWLDGWCVDWQHAGGPLCASFEAWRGRRAAIPLDATHVFARPGRHVARVRAYDVLGGAATCVVRLQVGRARGGRES